MSPKGNSIEVLFEDEYLLAINKPANVLSIPDSFRQDVSNVFDIMKAKKGDLFINHRLDRAGIDVSLIKQLNENIGFKTFELDEDGSSKIGN